MCVCVVNDYYICNYKRHMNSHAIVKENVFRVHLAQFPCGGEHNIKNKRKMLNKLTQRQSPLKWLMSGTTHSNASAQRYIVSAATSPNHTVSCGVKLSPANSNMATSPPPFKFKEFTIGTGVTGDL